MTLEGRESASVLGDSLAPLVDSYDEFGKPVKFIVSREDLESIRALEEKMTVARKREDEVRPIPEEMPIPVDAPAVSASAVSGAADTEGEVKAQESPAPKNGLECVHRCHRQAFCCG